MPVLPIEAYTTQAWYEQARICSRTWAFAGLAEDVAEPGQYAAVQAGLNNIFIRDGPRPAPAGVPQRLPAPRHAVVAPARQGEEGDHVPVPRLDVRPGGASDRSPEPQGGVPRSRHHPPRAEARRRRPVARHAVGAPGRRRRVGHGVVRRGRTAPRTAPCGRAGREPKARTRTSTDTAANWKIVVENTSTATTSRTCMPARWRCTTTRRSREETFSGGSPCSGARQNTGQFRK